MELMWRLTITGVGFFLVWGDVVFRRPFFFSRSLWWIGWRTGAGGFVPLTFLELGGTKPGVSFTSYTPLVR